jgi:Predicted nucleotide-binding protein containing TIR-like domain
VTSTLAKVFGEGTIEYIQYAKEAEACWYWLSNDVVETATGLRPDYYRSGLVTLLNKALSLLTEELDIATTDQPPGTPADKYGEARPDSGRSTSAVPGSKIFIGHGHDSAALHEVARFIEQLGLEPIVLRDQPDQRRTIIEKFEKSAGEVGFCRCHHDA